MSPEAPPASKKKAAPAKKKRAAPAKKKKAAPAKKKRAAPAKKKRAAPAKKRKAAPARSKKAAPGRSKKAATAKTAAEPHTPPTRAAGFPGMADGASARRAATSTFSLDEVPLAAPSPTATGPGLDSEQAQEGSLMDEVRRFERQVTRRLMGQELDLDAPPPSFIDRVGQLLDPGTYRRWLSGVLMRTRSEVVDDFGLDPLYAERWRPLFAYLYRQYWRVQTSGMENVPDRGRALLVANHSGTLPYDGAMIMYAVRYDHPAHRDVRPLVEDFVFYFPFLGVFLNRTGCVRACQENAERLLLQDRVVAVFPEGIQGISKLYQNRYQLQRFGRGGFIKLALKNRTPIIPTAVVGAEEIHPMLTKVTWLAKYLGIPYVPITPTFPWLGPLGLLPFPTKWIIRFGEPIDPAADHGPDAHQDRLLVSRLTEQVRSSIQGMVDEILSARRSVVFG